MTAVRQATRDADAAAAAARSTQSKLVLRPDKPEEPTLVELDDPDDPLNDPDFSLDGLSDEKVADGYPTDDSEGVEW